MPTSRITQIHSKAVYAINGGASFPWAGAGPIVYRRPGGPRPARGEARVLVADEVRDPRPDPAAVLQADGGGARDPPERGRVHPGADPPLFRRCPPGPAGPEGPAGDDPGQSR